jgi:hypothetical protein
MLNHVMKHCPAVFKISHGKTELPYLPMIVKVLAVKNYRFAFNLNELNLGMNTDRYIDCLNMELDIYKVNKSKRFKGIMGKIKAGQMVFGLDAPKVGFSFSVWKSGRVVVYSKSGLISDVHLCRDLLLHMFRRRHILFRKYAD